MSKDLNRCPYSYKKQHRGTGKRSERPSSWQCIKKRDHSGPCQTHPRANQKKFFWPDQEDLVTTPRHGFIYADTVGDGVYKIGRSNDREGRTKAFQTAHHKEWRRDGAWEVYDTVRAESWIHGKLSLDHVRGEHFRVAFLDMNDLMNEYLNCQQQPLWN